MPNWILIILIRTVITDMWTLVIEAVSYTHLTLPTNSLV